MFHVPSDVPDIARETLFGREGKVVRYWGYCFDENEDPQLINARRESKRLLFLSEKERAVRAERALAAQPGLSPFTPPTIGNLRRLNKAPMKGVVRHQVEVFRANELCYIMTDDNLAIGTDEDGDWLNRKLEQELNTNPKLKDTDGDGLPDGVEYTMHANPLLRDSDADGLIDGFEDKNLNGKAETGETSPIEFDTDKDRLCDGQCRIRLPKGRTIYAGEDKNLNGKVDTGESNPTKKDSDGDKLSDYEEFMQCIAKSQTNC